MSKPKIPTICPHCGRKYDSIKDKCRDHQIPVEVFYSRMEKGWGETRAITEPIRYTQDHLGQKFSDVQAMCDHYHIAKGTFYYRKRKGLSLEECLLGERKYKGKDNDWFSTRQEMLEKYNVSSTYFYQKQKENRPLTECLTKTNRKGRREEHSLILTM